MHANEKRIYVLKDVNLTICDVLSVKDTKWN